MSESCIFCEIVNENIPASKVYEDDYVIAFMDIKPIVMGHVLVIPKTHFRNALDTPEDIGGKIYSAVVKVSNAIKKTYNADGINIIQNNEAASGQEVFHSHLHVIPRFENDRLNINKIERLNVQIDDIIKESKKIMKNF